MRYLLDTNTREFQRVEGLAVEDWRLNHHAGRTGRSEIGSRL